MTYQQMFSMLDETGLSDEAIGDYFGLSGMTLRRWRRRLQTKNVAKVYLPAAVDAVHKLLIEGHLSFESGNVQDFLARFEPESFSTPIRALGITDLRMIKKVGAQQQQINYLLFEIGMISNQRAKVASSGPKIASFKKFGANWNQCIGHLTEVIESRALAERDKAVAYGALAYLISPFKLIPDSTPIVGHLDEFGIISTAAFYYSSKPRINVYHDTNS